MDFQDPIVVIESVQDFKTPRLVSVLDERGNDGQHLIAVLQLYENIAVPGINHRRNHVLITIYEKTLLPGHLKQAVEKNRVLYIKKGISSETVASLQLAGTASDKTLKKNVAQFKKKVKAFRDEHKISYSLRDSEDNQLTEAQAEFFKNSKARDKNGSLLTLYHGTGNAGFTIFDPSRGRFGGNWFTTSRADADSYGGNYHGKLFDPNEMDEERTSVGGNFTLGSWMRFDSEADRAEFLKSNPNAETVKTDDEYGKLLSEARRKGDWDEYDRLEDEQYKNRRELQKLQSAYDIYEWEHSRTATIGELFENPDRFSMTDVYRAWDSVDRNNTAKPEVDIPIKLKVVR